ncbi:MAG: hypothetical protein M1821_010066 [Bathelium mastoideum]|nr:MAG: hypothetical protein M1821_010066 [Bathelium mastoideum]
MGGDLFYILSDPRHVATFYRETETLPFDHFLAKTIAGFGISKDGIKKIFEKPLTGNRKSIVWRAHDMQAEQTRGRNLLPLAAHVARTLQKTLVFELDGARYSARTRDRGVQNWSLKTWTTEIMIHAIQDAYFGEPLAKIDPELPHILAKFDELSYQAWYRYPSIITPTRNRLEARIRNSLKQFFDMPKDQRKSPAWFTQSLEDECRAIGFQESDLISLMMFMYWGITTNTSKVGFWIFAHVIFQPELGTIIRAETAPALRSDGSIDTEYLVKECPKLNSIWLETLRLSASSTAVRYIVEDTKVGETVLPKGNALMYSARQLHLDNGAFGEKHNEFDPMRFYNRPSLGRDPSYRPFGGGETLCPGRHLAKHVVLTFVALSLRRYNFSLAFPQSFPRYKECKPAIGVIGGCDDLIFQVERRE